MFLISDDMSYGVKLRPGRAGIPLAVILQELGPQIMQWFIESSGKVSAVQSNGVLMIMLIVY